MLGKAFNNTVYKIGLILSARVITALLSIILLPVYIRYLGVESYGLVAFYATLAGALSILGTGLSGSTNREVSISFAQGGTSERLTSLLFSVELLNWLIAFIACALLLLSSSFIAEHWINSKEVSTPVINYSVMIMGLMFACQMPAAVYEGALNGMQRQGDFAIINLVFAIVKSVGVILVLEFIRADIITYFLWNLLVTLCLTIALRLRAYQLINPLGKRKIFSLKLLKSIKKFALGMTGIAVVSFFISQVDKVIVSKYLLLDYVGYYNIAFLLAGLLGMIASPIHTIVLPKFNNLEAQSKSLELKELYYRTSKWMTILVVPLGFALIAFSHDILLLWTKNTVLANETSPILKVVALGSVFNSIASVFYLYTLAKGNTRYGFYQNLICIAVILPLIIILTQRYGALGAGSCWLIYNALLLTVSLPVFHHLYIKGELFYWVRHSFIFPFLLAAVLFLGVKWLQLKFYPGLNLFELAWLILLIMALYAILISDTRNYLLGVIKKINWKGPGHE